MLHSVTVAVDFIFLNFLPTHNPLLVRRRKKNVSFKKQFEVFLMLENKRKVAFSDSHIEL